jgi:two-component sensor histidine kinase
MSLPTRLFLLTLLVALPIFGILFAQQGQLLASRRADILADAKSLVAVAAAQQTRSSAAAQTLLVLAANVPAVRALDPTECSLELAKMVTTIPGISGIAAWSARGDRYCTNNPDAPRVEITDRPYFQEAVKTGKFVNSGYIVGRSSGTGQVVFVYPALDAAGNVEAILVLPVAAATLSATLNNPLFPEGTFTAVIDYNGVIAARWPSPEDWLGKQASDTAWGRALAKRENTFTEAGTEYALVAAPIGEDGQMSVVLGLPITPAIAEIQAAFLRSMTLIVAAFVIAALGALLVARAWVGRPIHNLQAAADAMAAGNLKVRPPRAAIPEVQALSEKFVQMAAALELRLQQKDSLLKEVNHRVKNSLQLVSSVLTLHRAGISDERARRQFDEAATKVDTVARVHQRLYRDEDVESLAFGTFLEEMCKDLEAALSGPTVAQVRCSTEECRLPTDVAIPLALIVNELVTNAAKHAYPAGGVAPIRVTFKKEGSAVVASVADDGPLTKELSESDGNGLGMRLVATLLRQLRGSMEIVPQKAGKAFVVRVPV